MRRRQGRPGLVGTMARTAVIAGTATAVSGSVAQRQQAEAQAAQTTPPPPGPAAPAATEPPPAGTTLMGELERLVELKQQGMLTEDEFTALKARLLAG
jgi:hypothetical protein